MEIPYGKREFIVEEEEQQQQQQQQHPPQQQVVHPVEEPSIRITQENCHAQAQKMLVVQEQHVHAHLLVSRPRSYSYIMRFLFQAMQENHEPVAKRMKTQEAPSFYAQVCLLSAFDSKMVPSSVVHSRNP